MKHRIFILILLPLLMATVGCRNDSPANDMTNEEILNVLDLKIHKHPKDDNLYYDRAKIYMKLDRYNDAIADLSRAVSLNDKETKYHMLLGDAYFANGDVEHSYKSLQRVLELEPESTEAYLKLGEIAYYSRDYDRAMDNLSKVTAKDPQNRTALFMKGFIYKETGDTSNAVQLLRKVCDLHPDYGPAFEELGMLYATRHDPLAIEYLNTALRIDPKNTNALYGLAMYYQDLNKPEQAEEIYKQILDIITEHRDVHLWRLPRSHQPPHPRNPVRQFLHRGLDQPGMRLRTHGRQTACPRRLPVGPATRPHFPARHRRPEPCQITHSKTITNQYIKIS